MAQQQLDFELAVLRALPGVSSVADFPPGGVSKIKPSVPQDNGVRLKLNQRKLDQRFNSNISDKVTAARELKNRLKGAEFVGEAAVLAAEEQVRLGAQPAPHAALEVDYRCDTTGPGEGLRHREMLSRCCLQLYEYAQGFRVRFDHVA